MSATAPELATQQPITISLHIGTQTLNLQLNVQSETENVTVQENAGPTLSAKRLATRALWCCAATICGLADDPVGLLAICRRWPAHRLVRTVIIFIDGFSDGELPPKESIREIRINSNPFLPEYDTLDRQIPDLHQARDGSIPRRVALQLRERHLELAQSFFRRESPAAAQ